MQLEDYFEFIDPDDIRIKGHRISIDNVIQYYLQGYSPEQIIRRMGLKPRGSTTALINLFSYRIFGIM